MVGKSFTNGFKCVVRVSIRASALVREPFVDSLVLQPVKNMTAINKENMMFFIAEFYLSATKVRALPGEKVKLV